MRFYYLIAERPVFPNQCLTRSKGRVDKSIILVLTRKEASGSTTCIVCHNYLQHQESVNPLSNAADRSREVPFQKHELKI